jgi:hypothetical protein
MFCVERRSLVRTHCDFKQLIDKPPHGIKRLTLLNEPPSARENVDVTCQWTVFDIIIITVKHSETLRPTLDTVFRPL